MIRTQIYITPEQHKKLKLIYAESGQKITETIRQAIEEHLKNESLFKVPNRKAVK